MRREITVTKMRFRELSKIKMGGSFIHNGKPHQRIQSDIDTFEAVRLEEYGGDIMDIEKETVYVFSSKHY